MSSQDIAGIPLSASHSHESFKLLELPSELQQLLESENPPKIHLKSAESTDPTQPGYALLCAGEKTYRVQQKSSSNPIMVLRPSTSRSGPDIDSQIPVTSVTRIAVLEDTLELTAEKDVTTTSTKARKWHEKFAKDRARS